MCCPVLLRIAPDERVALPRRELVAVVEREPGDGDCRHPEDDRFLESWRAEAFAHARAVVVAAERHARPPVVLARLESGSARRRPEDLLPWTRGRRSADERRGRADCDDRASRFLACIRACSQTDCRPARCRHRGGEESSRCATPGPAPPAGSCDRRARRRGIRLCPTRAASRSCRWQDRGPCGDPGPP